MTAGSYLDDPDLRWTLDPASLGMDAETVLGDLLSQQQVRLRDALIIDGAQRLYARGAGTAAECLHTSMIWFYG
ncbi:MAG TPA: hypothetical protein VFG15_06960 [Amycolatopsis sp.]|nr:hypothetical protein [Amycolatopsis sp.]